MVKSFSRKVPFVILVLLPLWTAALPVPQDDEFRKLTVPYMGGPRIAILHMYNEVGFFQRLGTLTRKNKKRYATRHRYEFIESDPHGTTGLLARADCDAEGAFERFGEEGCFVESNEGWHIDRTRAPTFGKIKLSLAACVGRKDWWLLWSDADAMIVNQTTKLESIIDDGYDIMMSYDWLMINAGVILWKCSEWNVNFLTQTYNARSFDKARALDQSALQKGIDSLSYRERAKHIKFIPKHAINVYLEEYRPGDFLIHMAGKLYEATEAGLWAIANQLDLFSKVEDFEYISAFFDSKHLLNTYSGLCPVKKGESQHNCKPNDPRRIMLNETLGSMSYPNRYRHVGLRYSWLKDWKDKYDVSGWNKKRKELPVEEQPGLPPPLSGELEFDGEKRIGKEPEDAENGALEQGNDRDRGPEQKKKIVYTDEEQKQKELKLNKSSSHEVHTEDHADEIPELRQDKAQKETGKGVLWAAGIVICLIVAFFLGPGVAQKIQRLWKRRVAMRAHKSV